MAIADLKNVLKIFGGSDISDDERSELFKETLLMTLARWLGDAWTEDWKKALAFIRLAAERKRFDVVGAFLRRAETPERSFLATLDELRQHVSRRVNKA